MLRYPKADERLEKDLSTLQQIINKGEMWVGRREYAGEYTVTCVHISKNKEYFFTFDRILLCTYGIEQIPYVIKTLYEEGQVRSIIIPQSLLKDIDYIFIPSEFQLTGTHQCGFFEGPIETEEYFEWYKLNKNCARAKGDRNGNFVSYWLSDHEKSSNNHYCYINQRGEVDIEFNDDARKGILICFAMHEKGKILC
jgi:hypothetical protein